MRLGICLLLLVTISTPIVTAQSNNIILVDGVNVTLPQGLAKCPTGRVGCHIQITNGLTLPPNGITYTTTGNPLWIEGVGNSDQNAGGTVLHFAPTTAGQSAFNILNSSRFKLTGVTIVQDNTAANTNCIYLQGTQGADIDSVVCGISGGGAGSFTGVGLFLQDSANSSGIRNQITNSVFIAGVGCLLQQYYVTKVVNANSMDDVQCSSTGTSPSYKLVGNSSENSCHNCDFSTYGLPPVMVIIGDGTNLARGNTYTTMTLENTGGNVANQVGWQNNGQATWIQSESQVTSPGFISYVEGTRPNTCGTYIQTDNLYGLGLSSTFTCPNIKIKGINF